jgi:hypothetical protein
MWKRLKLPAVLLLLAAAVYAASAASSTPPVTSRSGEMDGQEVGEVLIGDQVVIVLRTASGQYTPADRAAVVASRLGSALAKDADPSAVVVAPVTVDQTTYQAIYAGDRLIATVSQQEADAHQAAPVALARLWRDNILFALGDEPPPPPPAPEQPAPDQPAPEQPALEQPAPEQPQPVYAVSDEEVDWTSSAQKWVPIFSLETGGASVGAAQIAGPKSQVDKVKAVAQLRLEFRGFARIYAYIPVSRISTSLDRVQGVSVWAIGDVELINF